MTTTKRPSSARRPILRLDLAAVSIDDRPNTYKDPQLVLKPHLVLTPRGSSTELKARAPYWKHFLMIHVRDKAEELVKLDLISTFGPSAGVDQGIPANSIRCSSSRCSLVFEYVKDDQGGFSTIAITLQKSSDLETVLKELSNLHLRIDHEDATQERQLMAPPSLPMSRAPVERTHSLSYGSSISTSFEMANSQTSMTSIQRPPSQPMARQGNFYSANRPWSPAVVPSRPATSLGVPLREGIWKVSKIGSTGPGRPRSQRTPTLLDQHQAPRIYTVSRHFDKTLGSGDIDLPSGGQYRARGLSFGSQTESQNSQSSASQYTSQAEGPASQPVPHIHGVPDEAFQHAQSQLRVKRLRTAAAGSDPRLTTWSYEKDRLSLRVGEYRAAVPPRPTSAIEDGRFFSSSPTLLGPPTAAELGEDVLLQIFQTQHLGLCDANKIWTEFMEKANTEVARAGASRSFPEVLSKLEGEFMSRWTEVVANTARKMKSVQVEGHDL